MIEHMGNDEICAEINYGPDDETCLVHCRPTADDFEIYSAFDGEDDVQSWLNPEDVEAQIIRQLEYKNRYYSPEAG